ncbi:alkylation response protein AidB-like acyl-CoA dehydrogenase [Thermocatellispora tengchongensis]|uniref:Alkylation response protein AidB-like acyl-CoA dehydrogenase n=1 Tax=Thermocatellispora tengchongensis TaxID=1073253 RepID=A0A840P9K9_9ACTN|nr:acyl-CoA dehydrogenase family protein [Thermocatellispora tengchongensis]MBB5135326.1 alkylation response protein AidB-like acyl-CoA dehydrogenase [Thermocatellispora tengchongensis]
MSTDLVEFRQRAREWLAANAPAGGTGPGSVAEARAFMAKLYDAGFSGISWPAEWGGQGLGQAEQRVFDEEAGAYTLPTYYFSIGLGMCGPTVVDLGTDEQRRRWVRRLLRGEDIWCQLFSEPNAGSDVAALQTRAERAGDGWVVNGQKVWTSVAQHADLGLLLARTDVDAPKHKGLTMFVIDMHAPGVTVRPLKDMSGRSNFNEIFFDDVHVPDENRIGEVNDGWRCAVTTLLHERLSISGGVGGVAGGRGNPASFEALRATCDTADPVVRDALVELYVRERALELFNARLGQETRAGIFPGARGSAGKLLLAELTQFRADLATSLAGPAAVAWDPETEGAGGLAEALSVAPGLALGGGTNEIMRNIIGDRVLNLPPEPRADKNVPFKDLKVGTQQ